MKGLWKISEKKFPMATVVGVVIMATVKFKARTGLFELHPSNLSQNFVVGFLPHQKKRFDYYVRKWAKHKKYLLNTFTNTQYIHKF